VTSHATALAARRGAGLARLAWALPAAALTVAAAVVYVWQSTRHGSPWLFSDEIEYTELSRAVADTGEPARRGVVDWDAGLYPFVIAPFWWIADTERAYDWIRGFDAVLMASAVLPAYGLARLVASRPWALVAAAGAGAIPAYAYSSLILQEPLAYPAATLTLWLGATALARRTRGWAAAAVVASLVAPFTRDELVVLPAALLLAAALVAARSERARRLAWRWGPWEWIAAAAALGLLVVLVHLAARGRAYEWQVATDHPGKMAHEGVWALGAFACGLGVFPLVIGLALVVLPGAVERSREVVAFHSLLVAGLLAFGLYTAAKASYLSVVFEPRIVERNLVYATPLLTAATALFLQHRRVVLPALAASGALVLWAITQTPYPLDRPIYADAPGTSILAMANRMYGWTPDVAEHVLVGLAVASLLVGVVPRLLGRTELVTTVVAGLAAVLAVGWSFTGELAAVKGSHEFADTFRGGTPKPLDWVDRATGGEPALYLGAQIADPNPVWLLEFWNRSVQRIWSIDGSAPGPGPTATPNVESRDGRLSGDPGYRWAVADAGVELVGEVVDTKGRLRLYRLEPPLRLEQSTRGLFNDGWLGTTRPAGGATAVYARFSTPTPAAGTVDVDVSRAGWCSSKDIPGNVLIAVGPLALGPERNGVVGRVTQLRAGKIGACGQLRYTIPAPPAPFAVEVRISPLFVPNELDPRVAERRHLGAQVGFGWRPGRAVSAAP
jgi:hypothetical protein